MPDAQKIIRQEISVNKEAGYLCAACGYVNVVFNQPQPPVCLNCGGTDLKLEWAHTEETKTTVYDGA